MRKHLWNICLCAVAYSFSTVAHATPILALSSSADLDNIVLGAPVTISVNLSGLEIDQSLSLLGATVAFDGSAFSVPTISAEAIVPDPLADPLDFLSSADVGLADAGFFTFSLLLTDQITQNGVFYSFTLIPIQAGAGSFELTFVDAGLFDPENPDLPATIDITAGPAIPFQVIVPEPSSAFLAASSAILLVLAIGVRKRRS